VFILDKLDNPGKTVQNLKWQFFTDGVMGGLSSGNTIVEKYKQKKCYRMTGNVTTANNGGFIQMRVQIKHPLQSHDYTGVYLNAFGNNHKYAIHIRTSFTVAPWQYYASSFFLKDEWTEIKLPFSNFKKSNFYQPRSLLYQQIKTVGIVAAFDDFYADIAVSEIGFY
tara:strand:- start:60 stop:560 length:501 start_codon:yes stop_codon:yes gene_type:complete